MSKFKEVKVDNAGFDEYISALEALDEALAKTIKIQDRKARMLRRSILFNN